jgi:hypothetical protein
MADKKPPYVSEEEEVVLELTSSRLRPFVGPILMLDQLAMAIFRNMGEIRYASLTEPQRIARIRAYADLARNQGRAIAAAAERLAGLAAPDAPARSRKPSSKVIVLREYLKRRKAGA